MDVANIVASWNQDKPIYKKIETVVVDVLKKEVSNSEILPEITSRTKELLSIVKKIKKKLQEKDYSYDNLNDKLGIRIICTFESELDIVDSIIKRNFTVKKTEYKKNNSDYNVLNYQSNHYDVCIDKNIPEFKNIRQYENRVFEIQVRTLNQHAWSNASHKLSYKHDGDLPHELQRKLYRLLALYELADQEIENINNYLKAEENSFMNLLSKIEGKFYKYAKIDYDKEITIDSLTFFSTIFNEQKEFLLKNGIEKFVSDNDKKITAIFEENRFRFHEIPIITQPEIFIMWFSLENFENALTDNWNNHFDYSDLEKIQTLWGGLID